MGSLTRRRFLTAASALAVTGWPSGSVAASSINPRSAWAANRPPLGPLQPEEVRFLIVHHSASRNGHTGADAPGILRSFYDFHTGEKGWNDIAYNLLIDADGGIWEGRAGSLDGPVAGDATGGNQGFSQLVCLIGDFNIAQPSPAALGSLVWLLSWMADRYSISTAPGATVSFVSRGSNRWPAGAEVSTATITGHRTMSQTSCPGANLWAYVSSGLTADVEALRTGAAPTPTTPSTTITPPSSPTTTSLAPTTTSPLESTPTTQPPTTTTELAATSSSRPATTTSPPRMTSTVPTTSLPPVAASPTDPPSDPGADIPVLWVGAGVLLGGLAALLRWRRNRLHDG